MKYRVSVSASALAAALIMGSAPALADEPVEGEATEAADTATGAIIVTGTRTIGMKAADSPAPIQIMSSEALGRTGQPDLVQSLAQNLPSIQVQSFGSDLQAHNLQMKLRGMSPNHTLILVNGKRRHGTANVSVAGGPFGGSAAPDVSFIVPESIDHVEVLQDGAAAQYGTDAIAGVINFIQKKSDHGGTVNVMGGQYMDQGGQTYSISGDIGLAPFDGAYLNIAAQKKFKDYSFRGDINPQSIYYAEHGYPGVKDLPGYPYTNRIIGDPRIDQTVVSYNAGYEFGDYEIYSFGSYGHKDARAYENTRAPTVIPGMYPSGFAPQEHIDETDYSVTGGFKGLIGDTTFDFASTYGKDIVRVYVENSGNAELYADTGFSPTHFHNGDFKASQWTNTLDLTHQFDVGLAEPLNVAAGLEYRHETYGITAGDPASYYGGGAQSFFGYSPNDAGSYKRNNFSQYLDLSVKPVEAWLVDGAVRHEHYSDFGDTTVFKLTSRYDFTDAVAVRGTASTGFRAPTLAEGGYSGLNVGPGYIGGVLPPSSAAAQALGFGALKPEKSTSFSAGLVFNPAPKLTITLDAYQTTVRNRIMISSTFYGFSGNYCPAGSTQSGCLPYDADSYNIYNQLAVLGAVNAALGGSGTLTDWTQATAIPSYVLYLDDGVSRNIDGSVAVQTFVNGVKMRTRGVDLVVNYQTDLGSLGIVDWTLNGNYNANKVQGINGLPSALYSSTISPELTALIDDFSVVELEHSTPRFRATANAFWTLGKFSANLRERYYSEVYQIETAPSGSPVAGQNIKVPVKSSFLTDLELSYQIADPIRISIGADNLFNKYPTERSYELIRKWQLARGVSGRSYSSSKYPTYSPYGINGGFYYAKLSLTF
ncbi:TonB-dependent receptor plug domain-containing protein [Novosphingobium clariflavum]|uniref:TonB-dependent receptor plug domain-containing protein n=1 Tax=Novosphingobium clariflavum TaxID=2029884 RepID=A0ABV6SDZ8_9SPHN|nr:TonB-dependent receptor [Novosphingobium clariflavum]